MSFFFPLAFTRWCCLRYHISPRDPHFPASYPSSPDPESGPGGKERRSEQRPRGGPGFGPASVVGLGMRLFTRFKAVAPAALFLDKAHFFLPSPIPDEVEGAFLPVPCLVGDLGLQGGRCILPHPRSRVSADCGGRSVTWPPPGGERHGPRGAVPLSPRAAAFVSPRGCADHEARALVWRG